MTDRDPERCMDDAWWFYSDGFRACPKHSRPEVAGRSYGERYEAFFPMPCDYPDGPGDERLARIAAILEEPQS